MKTNREIAKTSAICFLIGLLCQACFLAGYNLGKDVKSAAVLLLVLVSIGMLVSFVIWAAATLADDNY